MNAKLPFSLADLKKKLQKLKDLAAGLPDSTSLLDQTMPQLDTARRLLKEAKDSRWAAITTVYETMVKNERNDNSRLRLFSFEDEKILKY